MGSGLMVTGLNPVVGILKVHAIDVEGLMRMALYRHGNKVLNGALDGLIFPVSVALHQFISCMDLLNYSYSRNNEKNPRYCP